MAFTVYMIKNKVSGKVYIGATTQTLRRRYWGRNLSRSASNKSLRDDANKFGKDAFEFYDLCICNSKEELDKKENEFILEFDSTNPENGYNTKTGCNGYPVGEHHKNRMILNLGENRRIGWKHMWENPAQREKMSKAISIANKGKKKNFSEETIKAMSERGKIYGKRNAGKVRPKRSEETKKKQSEAMKKVRAERFWNSVKKINDLAERLLS